VQPGFSRWKRKLHDEKDRLSFVNALQSFAATHSAKFGELFKLR